MCAFIKTNLIEKTVLALDDLKDGQSQNDAIVYSMFIQFLYFFQTNASIATSSVNDDDDDDDADKCSFSLIFIFFISPFFCLFVKFQAMKIDM